MVLSNAERRRRHRERLAAAAKAGVTPDDIRRVAGIVIDAISRDEPALADRYANLKGRSGRDAWAELFDFGDPSNIVDDEYGADTGLVRRVAAVAWAMRVPPEA